MQLDPHRQASVKNAIMLLSEFMEQRENEQWVRDIKMIEYQQRLCRQAQQLWDITIKRQVRTYNHISWYTFGRE